MKKSEKKIEKKVNKKIAKNKSKIYFLVSIVALLLLIIVILLCRGYRLPVVWANPDYICVKNVDMACEYVPSNLCKTEKDTNCCGEWISEWEDKWTRVCRWTKVTSVYYIHRRTECESDYYRLRKRTDSSGNSWRMTGDVPYTSTGCTVVEVDHVEPLWVWVSQ